MSNRPMNLGEYERRRRSPRSLTVAHVDAAIPARLRSRDARHVRDPSATKLPPAGARFLAAGR